MFHYSKYRIKEEDQFTPDEYPKMQLELAALRQRIATLPALFRNEIIISHCRDHSIDRDWSRANPELAELLSSNAFPTAHMEGLFESCRLNRLFQQQFEDYLQKQLSGQSLMFF